MIIKGLCKEFTQGGGLPKAKCMKFRVLELFSSCLSRNTMEAIPANSLSDVRAAALKACVIGIDEGQFVRFLFTCCAWMGASVPLGPVITSF